MPSTLYGGVRYILVRNAKYCNSCQDTIQSKSVHDFRTCRCGAVSVDGGLQYERTLGNIQTMEDRSMWRTEGKPKMYLPQAEIERRWKEFQTSVKNNE